ncbi:hypothetical protein [uncultured Dokdonia sp.]|uniref:hypothetical protein n=1 Tax=uncultured Dokdonia sp. TaxID=575653 RepID=UPI00261D604F|nr:hypothetical protein [uncultured Dokdonia sp.]
MKITAKEIRISGALIVGSGLLIGVISALCQKKPVNLKNTPEESKSKKIATPVVQMEVAFKSTLKKKPIEVVSADTPKVVAKEVISKKIIPKEVALSKDEESKEEEAEIELAIEVPMNTPEENMPKLMTMNDDFPLRLGSKGERVFALQKYLLRYHGSNGEVTDFYDQKLADRVLRILKVTSVDKNLFNKLMNRNKTRR